MNWFEIPCRNCRFFDGVSLHRQYYHCGLYDDWFFSMRYLSSKEELNRVFNCFKKGDNPLRSVRNYHDLKKAGFEFIRTSEGRKLYWARGEFLKRIKRLMPINVPERG